MDKPNYYAVIPACVRYDTGLSASEKLLYGELTALANKEGFAHPSNAYLAQLYGVDARTVIRWLNNLCEKQYIEVDKGGFDENGQRKTRRIFIGKVSRVSTIGVTRPIEEGDKNVMLGDKNVSKGVTKMSPRILQDNNNPLYPPRGLQERFDLFWSEYPGSRRTGKAKCMAWFQTHNPDDQTVDAMVKALRYLKTTRQWTTNDGQYIPMPATFLNQRRWEDDTAKPPEEKKVRWLT